MGTNDIVDISHETWELDDGTHLGVLLIACNLNEVHAARLFIQEEVRNTVRRELLLNLNVRRLLITAIGSVTANDFVQAWAEACASDVLFRRRLDDLQLAEVTCGNSDGDVLSEASLI